jgi:hypothetical protein
MRTKAYWEDKLSDAKVKLGQQKILLRKWEVQLSYASKRLKRKTKFTKPELVERWRYMARYAIPKIAEAKREILRIETTKIAYFTRQIEVLEERTVWDRLRSGDGLRV